jgi:DNA-binding HxlR family transcriptional regulator
MGHYREPYKRHTDVPQAQGAVMSRYEHTCMIKGDGGRTLRAILDQICNKWTLLVVATLDQGVLRFTELHHQVPGISQRMLTLTLRNLERDGLVSRTVHAEVPPRVEYALTPTGKSLIAPALALAGWAIDHVPQIEASREAYRARR